ncbi:tRNA (adenosine(37)-N6)-threonylcarbamoyltransferase complex dimerization subunit type 1 TsaB [Lactobacillus delbrueckii]|jgi:tRNA threonylcarbamoyladenosine biosynthesis protein TsaB|uniref:tRNA (adenosine(37)-N6)-threonylcarbamoyltransferase complex dimerization subunit type 1 TsaB n=1 Tax=Lactobacillus delbrueckii TaxID=1584 RepID=UPI0022E3B245|nr:tRNA (adenosine(37)-N6)-threonylcarbamoyltransferase complex dimerization subunit type 1 TsaB [Lactobacillus delbrueckii]MDK8261563.1 tRNA (adenosine(37)-N6)-threonylcarbamoyltransferase complex dimerization subunit type 1 TsaB [Lactobacillus delbrueckii]
MKILSISTATSDLSVALNEADHLVSEKIEENQRNHSVDLDPDIASLLAENGLSLKDIDRFAVAIGPGSYTGLRVGLTTAKMFASILNKELVGVSTLQALAQNFAGEDALIVAALDARNKNFFAGAYRGKEAVIADSHYHLSELLEQVGALPDQKVIFVGSDFSKYQEEIAAGLADKDLRLAEREENLLHASAIGRLAVSAPVLDPDQAVPNYLRRTQAEYDWAKKTGQEFEADSAYVEEV